MLIKSDELQVSDRKLGDGEFGNVFSGLYLNNGNELPVAIKILKGVNEPELIKEAVIMAQLDHPHLTKLVGINWTNKVKIVTPLRPLGCLKNFLRQHQNQLEPKELILYCYQISSAMEYLASKKIIHRDLATRNVLVKRRDHVEITDFGLQLYPK
jgi:serine/threonine protein kinase